MKIFTGRFFNYSGFLYGSEMSIANFRVVIQNEKYEDWRNTLINLRHVFVDYHDYLINFHKRKHSNLSKHPKGRISTAAQGNFLEVLNMSLNVFEKVLSLFIEL